jgi:hypothetical protein
MDFMANGILLNHMEVKDALTFETFNEDILVLYVFQVCVDI